MKAFSQAEEDLIFHAADRIKELEAVLPKLRMEHRYCEDGWYSCPKAEGGCANEVHGVQTECNCGADEHNALIDETLEVIDAKG